MSTKTLNELIASYNTLAVAAGLPTRKSFESKSKAEAAIATLSKPAKKAASGATLRVRKAGALHNRGPRGFKYGPVWMTSVKSGKGVAAKPSNLPKVKEHASSVGVSTTGTQEEILAALAKAI